MLIWLLIFIKLVSCISIDSGSFKCITDGLFEDDNDCRMYYECLWVGTAFEKQEHIKCAEKLIYNPRKHRCDDIGEFEAQFANGVQTGEELLEFMRFRNCIGSKNLIESAGSFGGDSEFENTSPPADYYPHVVLNDNRNENGRQVYDVRNYDFFHEINFRSGKKNIENYENDENVDVHKLSESSSSILLNEKIQNNTQNESINANLLPLTTISTRLEANLNNSRLVTKESNKTTEFLHIDTDLNKSTETPTELKTIGIEFKNTSTANTFKPDTKNANNTNDFDSLFLMEDERIYFGKKLYFDSLKTNNSNNNKNLTFEKVRKFNKTSENNPIRVMGTEKRRGFFKTFSNKNRNNIKAKASGINTTRFFKVFVRKNLIDASLDKLSSMNNTFLVDETLVKNRTLNESLNKIDNQDKKVTFELEKEDESVSLSKNKTKLADSFPSRNNNTIDVKNKSHIIFVNNSINTKDDSSSTNEQIDSLVIKEENKIVLNSTIEKNESVSALIDISIEKKSVPLISFRSRRLLSFEEDKDTFKTIDTTYHDDDDESISTTIDEEEIESTDAAYHDKDQAIFELTNRLINDLKPEQVVLNKTEPYTTSKSPNFIDSIEQRLTKRGKTNVEVVEKNETEKVILHTESDSTHFPLTKLSSFSLSPTSPQPITTLTTRRLRKIFKNNTIELLIDENEELNKEQTKLVYDFVNNSTIPSLIIQKNINMKPKAPIRSALKKQVKFVKYLPKLNYSVLEEHKEKHLDTLNKLLISANKRSKEEYSNEVEEDEKLGDDSSNHDEHDQDESNETLNLKNRSKIIISTKSLPSKKPNLVVSSTTTKIKAKMPNIPSSTNKITTKIITTTIPSKFFNKKSDEYHFVSSTGSVKLNPFTKFMNELSTYQSIASTAFIPSKHSSKPFMQTYRINQTKKLPNQFASLRLNYDQNTATKIDEVERGGKFQRLRVVPADTLIECKENDFGLECSCSITLSPPKCKQLINSFLSSCRILGCKNNGRCINMAYKYPIPYVCSCPSDYMGSYCEISRKDIIEEDLVKDRSLQLWRNQNIVTKIPTTLTTEEKLRPTITSTTIASKTNKQKAQVEKLIETEFKEPLCEPNPCMNNARCTIVADSIRCICTNSSFTGKFCEIYMITTKPTLIKTTTPTQSTTTQFFEPTTPHIEQSYLTRAFFWQCPQNCLFNLGRGFCSLSSSGYPRCVCKPEWTGIDCSQKNYCLNNECTNNSTCSNYPEMKSYLCICQKGYSGRKCEIDMRTYERESLSPNPSQKIIQSHILSTKTSNTSPVSSVALKQTTKTLGVSKEFKYLSEQLDKSSVPNPCLTEKCKNNGTCIMSFSHAKNKFSFVCKCQKGYYGPLCEMKENACLPNPCKKPASECIPLGYKKYECVCADGEDCTTSRSSSTTLESTFESTTATKSLNEERKLKIVNKIATNRPLAKVKSEKKTTTIRMTIAQDEKMAKTNFLTNSKEREDINIELYTKPKKILSTNDNPCSSDVNLCRKYPLGNESYICVKSFITQDYTLCLPTKSMSCKDSNPCLNGGVCVDDDTVLTRDGKPSWKCSCSNEFTGRLCETEICSPVHRLFSNHTMCLANSPNLASGGISNKDMELILDMHNTLRRQVAPIASNMQKMYWDVRLQHLAQKRAQLCSVDNTGILMRQQPGYGIVIGENLAAGYEKWAHVLTSWTSESKNFIYKSTSSSDNLQAGHYTQMIYSSASRIGCGFAQCKNTAYDRYFVCYYGEMQTYYSRYEPYQDGKSCSKCPNNCDNGLCDCKGAFCQNGGTMDLKTCTCSCPYSTFTGRYCENVICPKEDSPFCSQTLFEDKCWLYPVVRATCPYMCSLCNKFNDSVNATISLNKQNEIEPTTIQEIIDSLKKK